MTDRLALALAELVDALRDEARSAAPARDAPDRLLSVAETADMLGVGRSALYGELQAGRIRSIKLGRRRLVPSGAITAYINEKAAPDRDSGAAHVEEGNANASATG
jgi:excisionase family DNA binding protein